MTTVLIVKAAIHFLILIDEVSTPETDSELLQLPRLARLVGMFARIETLVLEDSQLFSRDNGYEVGYLELFFDF